jgi:hypothetical protein
MAAQVTPERLPRSRRNTQTWAIWALLEDGKPRTMNAITVALGSQDARLTPLYALEQLVRERAVEHTTEVPILFRRRAGASSPPVPAHIERDVLSK